ncbi:MAG: hypothetical protein HYZ37_14095 [Candidatus Solibacter usitatus]|nr:hypothetical protein [Candidatus Solibacter usitatus]
MNKTLAILALGFAPIAARLALLPWMPPPAPRLHDEFSHLLMADTIAHGRAVNPTHPLWPHFDSMHILSRPVYASPYPPAQGAALALGQMALGHPWGGVLLSIGLMCAAIVWMLQGWVSPRWALLGGVLVVARFGVFSYWTNSFYGGAVSAAAGALVLGGTGRMIRRRRWYDAAVFGLGAAVLANGRPYEGLVFTAACAMLLVFKLRGKLWRPEVVVPLAAVMAAAAIGMCAWFAQFTGNPLVMPYQFFRANFTEVPHFLFQPLRPELNYSHGVMYDYYHYWEILNYRAARENRPPRGVMDKVTVYARFYAGPALGLALAAAIFGWRRSRVRWLLAIGSLLTAALAVEVWHGPHYAAPGMGAMVLLAVEGLRQLRQARWGRTAVTVLCLTSLAIPVMHGGFPVGDGRERDNLSRAMTADGGKHLLVVRYGLRHDCGDEWVYNGADPDASSVVWARELDPARNRKMLEYFADRKAWLVEPDQRPVRVSEYNLQSADLAWAKMVREKLLELAAGQPLRCGDWNRFYFRVAGIRPPEPDFACYGSGGAGGGVGFEHWRRWLQRDLRNGYLTP